LTGAVAEGSWPGDGASLTRRQLVRIGGLAGLAALVPLHGFHRLGALFADPAVYLHRETYVPHVGTWFRARRAGASPVDLQLVDVRDSRPPGSEGFSLLFRARPGGPALDGRLRTLEHSALGSVKLFVAPVGRGVRGQGYEAIVNRGAGVPPTGRRRNG
jgi:hypothetical protein